uniref:Uncharacterized protein n=1 Tax=Sphaerodactylus townsendi TaxID=933632 RepID=A0ACB8FRW0_9SAUR
MSLPLMRDISDIRRLLVFGKPKPEKLSNNRAHEGAANSHALLNEGAEETVCYAMLRFPPGVPEEQVVYSRVNAPRVALDPSKEEVVYSVIKKPGPPSKVNIKL